MGKNKAKSPDLVKGNKSINGILEENLLFTRRQMLEITGIAGLTALVSSASFSQNTQNRPRIAVLASYWGATRSHADWIVNKLIAG